MRDEIVWQIAPKFAVLLEYENPNPKMQTNQRTKYYNILII